MNLRWHDPFPLVVLIGLNLEILGAFALAVEALGTDRVQRWADIVAYFTLGTPSRRPRIGPWTTTVVLAGMAFTAATPVGVIAYHVNTPDVFAQFAMAIIGGTGSLFIVSRMGSAAALFLRRMEDRAKDRTIGVFGFGLLFVGFVLQFIGVVGSFLIINSG